MTEECKLTMAKYVGLDIKLSREELNDIANGKILSVDNVTEENEIIDQITIGMQQ